MPGNPIQEFLSQIKIPFLGENLLRKYENEKSPLRAELLSRIQLESYAENLAETHLIGEDTSPDQLIRRLHENKEVLAEVRQLLIESAQENSPISPAGEWLLDNFYLIEEQIQTARKHFPKGYSDTLPKLAKGPLASYPRVYHIALELISHCDGRVDIELLNSFIEAYQRITPLNLGELWAIPIMLRLALIENLRRLAAQLAVDRINKNLADTWADRMIEIAESDPKSLIVATADMARSNPPMASSFVAEITRRLLGKGPALTLPLTWIEQRLAENGVTTNSLVQQESQKQASAQVSMSNSIGSLRFLISTDWRDFVEHNSVVEKILREDIDGIYGLMDFRTRDRYRHVIESLAKRSKLKECEVASRVIAIAKSKANTEESPEARKTHVGYYLIDSGLKQAETAMEFPVSRFEKVKKGMCSIPLFWYTTSTLFMTLALTSLLVYRVHLEGLGLPWLIVIGLIAFVVMSYLSVGLINWISTLIVKPDFLPRMNFAKGIPATSRTLVVVPTMIGTVAEIDDLMETMEVRYMANPMHNVYYALLTDFRDSDEEINEAEERLLDHGLHQIKLLNAKYRKEEEDQFFLFHRPRKWNELDKKWMGYERKRGKLGDLMGLLRGKGTDQFQMIAGDINSLHDIQYLLTLDTDTQLPRETVWKMVGTMSHPLNRAGFDEKKKRVTKGYGILQPRVATSITPLSTSWYAKLYASESGIDPYTQAVSDVYQDVLGEGSFIGKGILDIDAFESAIGDRFPENRILSHDLLEGCHARSGLISDVQLYEDYPAAYLSDMKRRHRWIRGDWQIASWLFPKVPGWEKSNQQNPISALSRWKIADNLRRSLFPPALLGLFLFGWLISPSPWFWTTIGFLCLLPLPLASFVFTLFQKPKDIDFTQHAISTIENLITHLIQQIWILISLPYEALVNLDAILRTLWRVMISHRHLLQWDPFSSRIGPKSVLDHYRKMWFVPALSIVLFCLLSFISIGSFLVASPLLICWLGTPLVAWAISIRPPRKQTHLGAQELTFLRKISRKTWAYFDHFIGPEDHYLPPDNYQEYPSPRVAHRTSPTNIGMALLSTLAAHDFGYISTPSLITRCKNTLDTLLQMERYKGHLFNWYDTITLTPLLPRYVSTVDSGNLAACLLTLKEGLEELKSEPVITVKAIQGMRDILILLLDRKKYFEPLRPHLVEIQSMLLAKSFTIPQIKNAFEHMLQTAGSLESVVADHAESQWWLDHLKLQARDTLDTIENLLPFLSAWNVPAAFKEAIDALPLHPGLNELSKLTFMQLDENVVSKSSGIDEAEINHWRLRLEQSNQRAKTLLNTIDDLLAQCAGLSDYTYDFLYDQNQHYLSIGYNVDEHRRDPGFYDLLGSEARLGVYVAVSQGKIPQESWFALGRQVTNSGKNPVLISWSGSMFEYLMPMLLMPEYENTLLTQSHKGAVERQIEYGRKRDLPWGISESCYNTFHANMDYQYQAFGVPGLGLKRGLGSDYVVAPYASVMALMVDPAEAIENLGDLTALGAEGNWGFYEAIDFTATRLPRGQHAAVVKAFMTHHQGMSLLALNHVLNGHLMQHRFENDLNFQTSLLLLQEKIPVTSSFFTPAQDLGEIPTETTHAELQVIRTPHTPIPEVQLLSNGRYHVMVSNAGGGYSRWNDLSVTRWREDGTCDAWGNFCFIRDLESDQIWSTAFQPTRTEAENYEVIFSLGRAEFRRRDQQFETHTEIVVSPEDDVELRRLHITNRSRRKRTIEITSYAEVVLNHGIAEMLHPAFSNLFVQTEINEAQHAIMSTRRARSADEHPPHMFHLMKCYGGEWIATNYETSRDQFIGRGNTIHRPKAIYENEGLKGHQGSVLDPIVSIQYKIQLKPYETITVDMIYGIGESREVCHDLVDRYQDKYRADRAFELAWTHSQVILRQINATPADALLYGRLAGSIIYANASLRADANVIIKNQRGQSGLWSHSISGDWPIVLLQIEDMANIALAQQMIEAHQYWKLKGLSVDLVIWNEDYGGYRQALQNQILALIAPIHSLEDPNKAGGIFVRSSEQLSNEDRILFQTVARVIISDKLGTLDGQLNRRKWIKPTMPALTPVASIYQSSSVDKYSGELQFYNGLGGYTKDGKEYVIINEPNKPTPAPWSNVIANPNFGTVISDSGQAYTWFQNAHELRLTPWHNDPITDGGGEHFYIRDENSGHYWSPCPLPARGKNQYVTRHGFGYSVFEHEEDGIRSEMTVYVDPDKPVKHTYIRIRNNSSGPRQLTVTGYVEWVLGDLRHKTMMHIVTEMDTSSGALIAHNAYQTEFGKLVAFFDTNEQQRTVTTDRTEFIGRNGTAAQPLAMSKSKLSGKTGAGFDPCGVIQVQLTLLEGEEHEVSFRMGIGMHINDISYLIREGRGRAAAREALSKTKGIWKQHTTAVQIESPDKALDLLTNGWLNYQTLVCRIWARSGYYQSGGAFGYRDQLQDVLSLLYVHPELARNQILLSASRQFVKGDVQHWWHPPVGRGVRTKCSDDYLWLPYVTSKYVEVTGDTGILQENIYFLESRELTHEEHSVYDLPNRSDFASSLYDHCIKALEYGFQFGSHGLPLIGSGDWNDGMDRVGTEGKGESVWLGWFLYDAIQKFIPLVQLQKDELRIARYKEVGETLRQNLNNNAWDGEWYRRAYFDDGTPLGSKENDECSIDAIAQSWAIISGGGDPDKSKMGLTQAGIHLVRKEDKIIQLLDPPFDKSKLNPGYIKGYVPGVRENGGQYTHAAIWMIMAYAIMKDRQKMWELLEMVLPVNHGSTKEDIAIYKVEPYVVAADVYAVAEHKGRGGWTWYTGSAGWLYQLITEYVFGLKRKGLKLEIDPCLPPHWDKVKISYRFYSTVYHITVGQNGHASDASAIALVDDGVEHHIEVL